MSVGNGMAKDLARGLKRSLCYVSCATQTLRDISRGPSIFPCPHADTSNATTSPGRRDLKAQPTAIGQVVSLVLALCSPNLRVRQCHDSGTPSFQKYPHRLRKVPPQDPQRASASVVRHWTIKDQTPAFSGVYFISLDVSGRSEMRLWRVGDSNPR